MKIKHYLGISSGAIMITALVISAMLFATTAYLGWQTSRASFARKQLSTLKDIDITLNQMVQELSSYLLLKESRALEKCRSSDAKLGKLLRYYETLVAEEIEHVKPEEKAEESQEAEFFIQLQDEIDTVKVMAERVLWLASQEDPAALPLFEELYQHLHDEGAFQKLPFQLLDESYEIEDSSERILTLHSNLQYLVLVAAISLVVIILVVARGLFRSIYKPMMSLVNALEEIGKGNFHVPIATEIHNEIGILASSIKNMAVQLSQVQAQLVQSAKLASLGQLTAGIAHELNQPLMVIRLNAQMLLSEMETRKKAPQDLEEMLRMIERNTGRMDRIIKHLKIFSRQAKNDERGTVDLNQVIEDSLSMFNEQLKVDGIEVRKTFAPHLPHIWGDANQLEQVFINLIANSKDALLDGDANEPKLIEISTVFQEHASSVEAQIHDTGSGVSEEAATHLFDPFYTTKAVGKGTGLGLSISYGIIQEHCGNLQLLATERQGATFLVRLPVTDETAIDL